MERKNWIDWMKTLGMLAIIWGHCFPEIFTPFLYAFSVGAFFFISGYLVKFEPSQRVFWRKIVRTLFIPYLFLSILKAIQSVFSEDGLITIGAILGGFHSIGDITGCGKLWFVYTLILLKILFQYVSDTPRAHTILIAIALVGAVMYCNLTEDVAWAVGNAMLSLPFFFIGHRFKHHQRGKEFVEWLKNIVWWKALVVICLSAGLTYIISCYNDSAWTYMGEYGNSLVLFEIGAFSGILFLLAISCSLDKNANPCCKLISIGSIVVLAYHQDIVHPILKWIRLQHWSDLATDMATLLTSIITLLLFVPIIYLISRYFSFIIGGRK